MSHTEYFLLFSSDHSPRYKRNILDILAYPDGHIFTLRYQEQHVSENIRKLCMAPRWKQRWAFHKYGGLSIYAETDTSTRNKFNFFPIRHVRLIRIHREGTVYYVDVQLCSFFNYPGSAFREESLQRVRGQLSYPWHPLPPPDKDRSVGATWSEKGKLVNYDKGKIGTQGCFFDLQKLEPEIFGQLSTQNQNRDAWERIIDSLGSAPSMKQAIFFSVLGLYKLRDWRFLARHTARRLIRPKESAWSTFYSLPSAARIELSLLFYRSTKADETVLPQTLEVKLSSEGFVGASAEEILVSSRYNEEKIEIGTKRVLERVITPLRIKLATKEGITPPAQLLASEPFLVSYVEVPRFSVAIILLGLLIGPFLLTMGPDVVQDLAGHLGQGSKIGAWAASSPKPASELARTLGSVITVLVGYLGLRKLPVGK